MTKETIPLGLPGLDPVEAPTATGSLPPEKVRELDQFAINELGIPGQVLMENAAGALSRVAHALSSPTSRILIIAGPGNNGGDGMASHRHLSPRSELILFGDPGRLKGDCAGQWSILSKSGIPCHNSKDPQVVKELLVGLTADDLIVDALFGTGLDREIQGPFLNLIEAVNNCPAKVLAVDIPSGLHGADGCTLGVAIKAEATVTFAATKTGLFKQKGPSLCGRIYLAGIGIPIPAQEAFLAT